MTDQPIERVHPGRSTVGWKSVSTSKHLVRKDERVSLEAESYDRRPTAGAFTGLAEQPPADHRGVPCAART